MTPAILVTRPAGDAHPLIAALRSAGYGVHSVPTVASAPVPFGGPLDAALSRLATFDWLVITSATGAGVVANRFAGRSFPPAVRVAAVGPRTARALEDARIPVAAVPAEPNGAAIADAIAGHEPLTGRRILLARADAAAPDLPDRLRSAGALVEEVAAYRTVEGPEASRATLAEALADPGLAAIVFASGSAVRGLLRLAGDAAARARLLPAITIGPSTSAVAMELGFRVAAQAREPSIDALLGAILAAVPLGPPRVPPAAVQRSSR